MEKKKKVCLGICVLILFCAVAFSSAFFSARMKTSNVITFGNIKIQLLNYMLDENNQETEVEGEEFPLHEGLVSRIVRVKNVCSEPAFVRVKISFHVETEQGEAPADGYVKVKGTGGSWIQRDEWLYYSRILQPGSQTEDFMRELSFDIDKLTDDYAGAAVGVHVEAQAVQSKHNGTEVLQAQGWPREVGRK